MTNIKLNDLNPAGFDLLADNEDYLNDLSEDELSIWGGNDCGGGSSGSSGCGSLISVTTGDINILNNNKILSCL